MIAKSPTCCHPINSQLVPEIHSGVLTWMWSFFCNFMWGPLLISWLPDTVSLLKNLAIFSNSFLCPSTKIGQVTKTFTISIVHLAKSARYGFLVHFLTILHFLGYLCSLVDADVTAEFYGQWSKTSMEKEWSNPSLTFHYTSIYFVIITQLFTLCFSLLPCFLI